MRLWYGNTESNMIKYSSSIVTKLSNLCIEIRLTEIKFKCYFNNKGQVAHISVQEHKSVPAKCSIENAPSKIVHHDKNAWLRNNP